jgi:hypothetical protein
MTQGFPTPLGVPSPQNLLLWEVGKILNLPSTAPRSLSGTGGFAETLAQQRNAHPFFPSYEPQTQQQGG